MKGNDSFYITLFALGVIGIVALVLLKDKGRQLSDISYMPLGFNPNDYVKKSDLYKRKELPPGSVIVNSDSVKKLSQIESWEQYKGGQ